MLVRVCDFLVVLVASIRPFVLHDALFREHLGILERVHSGPNLHVGHVPTGWRGTVQYGTATEQPRIVDEAAKKGEREPDVGKHKHFHLRETTKREGEREGGGRPRSGSQT